MFLHIGVIHLAVNMWCLWDLGGLAERIFGRGIFLAIYLIAGLTGAILGIAWHPFTVVAGASGAIFGVAGALLACFYFGELPFPRRAVKALLLSLLVFIGYNLLLGILNPPADNAAHIGGLVSGFLLGLLLLRIPVRYVLTSAALCLLLSCLVLRRTSAYTVYADRGRAAMASNNIDAAIAALSQSLRMKPSFAEGYSLLGQAYMQKQQYPQAEAAYRHALALTPKAANVQYELGVAVLAQGRTNQALAVFSDMATQYPGSADAQIGIGTATEMAGEHALALEAFRRATQLSPNNVDAYTNLGKVAIEVGKFDDAVAAFSKCVQLLPNRAEPLLNLARAYKSKGMEVEAAAAYQRASQLSQKHP